MNNLKQNYGLNLPVSLNTIAELPHGALYEIVTGYKNDVDDRDVEVSNRIAELYETSRNVAIAKQKALMALHNERVEMSKIKQVENAFNEELQSIANAIEILSEYAKFIEQYPENTWDSNTKVVVGMDPIDLPKDPTEMTIMEKKLESAIAQRDGYKADYKREKRERERLEEYLRERNKTVELLVSDRNRWKERAYSAGYRPQQEIKKQEYYEIPLSPAAQQLEERMKERIRRSLGKTK